MRIKRFEALIFLILSLGCAHRELPRILPPRTDGLPNVKYDAIFSCDMACIVRPGMPQQDTVVGLCQSSAIFLDTASLRLHGNNFTVLFDGHPTPIHWWNRAVHAVINESVEVPHSATWSVTGPSFPNFVHRLPTLYRISFLNFRAEDTLDIHKPKELLYSAPGSDTVTVHLAYQGIGLMKRDSAIRTPYATGVSYYNRVANTGRYIIPALELDSARWRFLNVSHLLVDISYTKSDTIHAENKIIGFATEDYAPIFLRVKH